MTSWSRCWGSTPVPLDFNSTPPVPILMVGLQGSGKTHHHRQDRQAAQGAAEQEGAARLARHPPPGGDGAAARARHPDRRRHPADRHHRNAGADRPAGALSEARLGGYDVLILDTAGRTHIDEELMAETAEIKAITSPHEILLVADALTGQDAVNLARSFDARVDITGIVLTRVDGDGRGGAALSMRAATGKPIKLIATGEKLDALDDFRPSSIADRILGHGRHRLAGREGGAERFGRRRRQNGQAAQEGQFRPRGSAHPAAADEEDGRHGRADGPDARHGPDQEGDGRRQHRRGKSSTGRSPSSTR